MYYSVLPFKIEVYNLAFNQKRNTVFPLISFQMQVLLENTTFSLHKIIRNAEIIRIAGIIRGRALYEEIRFRMAQIFYCIFQNAFFGVIFEACHIIQRN